MASTAKFTAPCAPTGAGIALLGGFRLLGHPGATLSNSCQRLLALLALRRSLDRSTAAGLLWPDYTEARAVHSLRSAVWRVHHSVDGILAVTRREVSLVPHIGVDTE